MFPIIIKDFKNIGKDVNGMTVGPFIFLNKGVEESTINHELIHYQQGIETLFIGLWIIYTYDYIKGIFEGKNSYDAYMSVRAEKEAYENENNLQYLSKRKRYEWIFANKKVNKKVNKKQIRRSKRLECKNKN